MLSVAIRERDRVSLLVQPGSEVNGDGRFTDATFGICNDDNHGATLHRYFIAGKQYVQLAGGMA